MKTITDRTPQAEKFFKEARVLMVGLYGRWLDEHEHEDLKGYWRCVQPIAARCGVQIEQMSGKPFRVLFSVGTREFELKVTRTQYTYRRLK